jgi:hypothetical protein
VYSLEGTRLFSESNIELNKKIMSLHQLLASELIAASPEHMNDVKIELIDRGDSIALSVDVSENPEDNFEPTPELHVLSQELGKLLRDNNLLFKSAILRAYIGDQGTWKYELSENQ